MRVKKFLDENGINYEVFEHESSFTAQEVVAAEHEPGKSVAKPVIVKAGEEYVMCVLPACYKIDMDALKSELAVDSVELISEAEVGEIFSDCDLGAEPPFGNLYDLLTVMDRSLEGDEYILFQFGTHEKSIRMRMDDYCNLVAPRVLKFSYHLI